MEAQKLRGRSVFKFLWFQVWSPQHNGCYTKLSRNGAGTRACLCVCSAWNGWLGMGLGLGLFLCLFCMEWLARNGTGARACLCVCSAWNGWLGMGLGPGLAFVFVLHGMVG